jgi:hypothetical protein
LVDTLEPATIATSGRFGFASAALERVHLAASSGPAHATGRTARAAVRRGLGAVRGAEGVVDVDVAERRHLLASSSLFFFSPLLTRQFSSSTTSPGRQLKPPSTQF